MPDPVEEAAAELYGLPLEDFTAERDARAKALRKDKQREAAAEVAKLRKPSRVAWAVNQLAREGLDELLEAGQALRAAQLEGGGDLRQATRDERAAVDAAVRRAADLGLPADGTDRLRTTLHALAGDEELRALVEAGRLVKEPEGGGAWPAGAFDVAPAEAPPPRKKQSSKPDDAAARRQAREQSAREKAEAEKREREERAAAKAAEAERRRLERKLKAARAAVARTSARLEDARSDHQEACDEVARLEEQLS